MPERTDLEPAAAGELVDPVLTDHERDLAGWLDIRLDRSLDELLASAAAKANRSIQLFVEVGLELMAAREQCNDGEWMPLLDSLGINRQRASEHIRVARFMARVKPADRPKMLGLPKTKVILLAKAEDDVIETLIEDDEEFDATAALTTRELHERIRELEKERHGLAVRLETAQLERDQALKMKEPDMHWLPEVQQVRDEAMYFTGVVMRGLDDLDQVLTALGDLPVAFDAAADQDLVSQHRAAAAAVYQAIAGPLGRVNQLLHRFRSELGLDDMAEDLPEHLPVLSDVEARQFYDNWKLMTRIAHSEKQDRELDRRRRAHRGKPGPKPGSKRSKA